jgi:UDP:flavonoid glycosyltransferase YjiC (YdhE family)
MANVVLVSSGTRGDAEPLLSIADALGRRRHTVSLITNCRYVPLAVRAGIPTLALDDDVALRRRLDDQQLLNDLRTVTEYYSRHIVPAWPREFAILCSRCEPGSIIVTLALNGVAAYCAAEAVGARLVTVFISPPQVQGLPFLAKFYAAKLSDDINRFRNAVGLPPVANWRRWLDRPVASIGNWPTWFSDDASDICQVVGFLTPENGGPGGHLGGLGDFLRERPVLISGGSGQFVEDTFYDAAVGGCAALGRTALVVTERRQLLPDALPPGIEWIPEIDHGVIMPQLSAIIHHGGINTIARALCAGVPQLILPLGHDRPDNAAMAQRLGVARALQKTRWSAVAVSTELKRLSDETVRRRCETYRHLLSVERGGAAARAAAVVEAACRG